MGMAVAETVIAGAPMVIAATETVIGGAPTVIAVAETVIAGAPMAMAATAMTIAATTPRKNCGISTRPNVSDGRAVGTFPVTPSPRHRVTLSPCHLVTASSRPHHSGRMAKNDTAPSEDGAGC